MPKTHTIKLNSEQQQVVADLGVETNKTKSEVVQAIFDFGFHQLGAQADRMGRIREMRTKARAN